MDTENIPPLPELRFAQVDAQACGLDGDRLSYREAGAGHNETLLLLHGIGTHAGGWRFILDGLSDSHRLIAWNAPGYYLSDHFEADAPDHAQYAAAAVALLDSLEIEKCHVVGSSFGSMIGAAMAALYPDRVQSLMLLGASRGQAWRPVPDRQARLQLREDLIENGGFDMAEKRWRQLLGSNPSDLTVSLIKQLLKAIDKRAYLQAARASDTADILQLAGRIMAPTRLLIGAEDAVNPPAMSSEIQAAIAGSEMTLFEGIGHLTKLEIPTKVIELLRQHIAGAA